MLSFQYAAIILGNSHDYFGEFLRSFWVLLVYHIQERETVLEGIVALREFDKGVLRKGIERIRVFGEGRIEVVWKAGDMFGLES